MDSTKQFNDKRLPDHDYKEPGTYHLLLDIAENVGTFGSMRKGVLTLGPFGEIFLAVLGMAMQIFSCLRVDALGLRPRSAERVVTITRKRKPLLSRFKKFIDRWHYRRTMTISVFAGLLKMNSSRRINTERGTIGEHFWQLGFKDRVLSDKLEIDELCAKLNVRFNRMQCARRVDANDAGATPVSSVLMASLAATFGAMFSVAPAVGRAIDTCGGPFETLLLGRAVFMNCSPLRPSPEVVDADPDSGGTTPRAFGGRTVLPLIWSVGPGWLSLVASSEN